MAASLAASLNERDSVVAHIVSGKTGEFSVHADGRVVWNKFETGRFPEHDEIHSRLDALA